MSLLNLAAYKILIAEIKFDEYPTGFIPEQGYLNKFIKYYDTDIDLKMYLAQLILCRSFYGTYTAWYADVDWFINSFFAHYELDFIKPGLTNAIKEAAGMIISEDVFSKKIIGTTFMFGILEFYAKHKLGFRPQEYNYFDSKKKEYIKQIVPAVNKPDLTIKAAFEYLQKQRLSHSKALNDIDTFTTGRVSAGGIESKEWTPHEIADRLTLARNSILHGELHSFYDKGPYLVMLYILFYLHDLKEHTDHVK